MGLALSGLFVVLSIFSTFAVANDETNTLSLVESDLSEFSNMQTGPTSPGFIEIFESQELKDLVDWFKSRIFDIQYDPNLDKGTLAHFRPGTMIIGQTYLKTDTVSRLAALMHEAAHHNYRSHSWCLWHLNPSIRNITTFGKSYELFQPQPQAYNPRCDTDMKSAWGATYTFLMSISDSCLNCPQDMKFEAKLRGVQAANSIWDEGRDELILKGSLDSDRAKVEYDLIMTEKIRSGLPFDKWADRCLADKNCLKPLRDKKSL